jgi:phosphoenolpyruvate synthase/pyruvate phosphate dikinase
LKTIFPFTSAERPQVDQVGGKAWSLITMTGAGMPVPPGFVLTVQFFDPWILALQARPEWMAAQNAGLDDLGRSTKALQSLCADLRFTLPQQEELDRTLDGFRAAHPGNFFAVRSSSPEEDLESASFAGGYETSLGIGMDGMQAAILHSFASSFDERVFLYKREHGFPTDQPRIAVIVQQQVDADRAGVAFSLNPLNNCFDEAVINANYGLGESVVAGEADPDVFVVDKVRHEIIDTQVGGKEVVIRLNPQGGTTRSWQAHSLQACLTPPQVISLAALLAQVEAYYQKPVDIEWAISQEKLYLLQARPITAYLPLPDEMITAPGAPRRLYANSTLIEQGLQEPLSVLGTDFLGFVLKQVGGPVSKDAIGLDGITFTAGGGYYMNLSYALKLGMGAAALAPGSSGDPRVTAILDSIDLKPYLSGELPGKLKALRGKMMFNMLPLAKSTLATYLRPDHTLRKYKAALPREMERFETLPGADLSVRAQAIELSERLHFFYGEYGIPMVLAAQIAQTRIKGIFKKEAGPVQDHLINLGVSLPGNKTTEMGEWMYALASSDEINAYPSVDEFLTALHEKKLAPEFRLGWEQFMQEFGARCPREIDVATPRPNEQPALLYEQLRNMSLSIRNRTSSRTFFEEARAKREAAYHALYEIARQKGKRKANALEKYYKTWVRLGGYRESGKHYVVKVIALFRRRALEIARTFVKEGRLDTPDQIFDLTIADMDRARSDSTLDLRFLAKEHSLILHKIKKSHLVARVIDSRGKIYYPPRTESAAGELSGVPISPGTVQGRVRVFHYANEHKLLPGEILVARATDPGWTPLFINAGGIVLEIGGALQHGAVVAREYGIPCVSGVDGATTRLKDGQMVEVDGSNGLVRILEEVKELK